MLRFILISLLATMSLVACGGPGKGGTHLRPRWAPESQAEKPTTTEGTQDSAGREAGIIPEAVSIFMGNVETKELKFDEKISGIKVLVMPTAEEGAVQQEVLSVTVHCASTLGNAIESDLGTVVLSAGSQVVIAREVDQKNTKKYLLLQCEGKNSAEAHAIPKETAEKIDTVGLALGATQLEAVLEDDSTEESEKNQATAQAAERDSDKTPSVSCKKEAREIAVDSLNGIYLLNDSDVLIHRNMDSALIKGKSQLHSRVVYSCR